MPLLPSLYFLHIPKTAGTTIRIWLSQYFAQDDMLNAHRLDELVDVPDSDFLTKRFFSGHFGIALTDKFSATAHPPVTITFLREPARLSASLVSYASSYGDSEIEINYPWPIGSLFRQLFESSGIDAALRSELWNLYFDDMQVRGLSLTKTEPYLPKRVDQLDLDIAMKTLRRLPFFGLVDQLEWSAALFADTFRLPLLPIDFRLNESRRRSSDFVKAIEDYDSALNIYDRSLYYFAHSLFETRVAQLRKKFGIDFNVGPDALAVPLKHQFQARDDVIPLNDEVIQQSSELLVDGFHPRFYDESAARWIRWSGRDAESRVYLPLDGSKARRVRFELVYCLDLEIRDELAFFIGNKLLLSKREFHQLSSGSWVTIFDVEVPVILIKEQGSFCEFVLKVPHVSPVYANDGNVQFVSAFALGEITVC